jgi:glutamate synthase domain-containing protein 3
MVDLEPLALRDDLELVRDLLIRHAGKTGSAVAERLLNDWDRTVACFTKVMPLDYRRVLLERKASSNGHTAPSRLVPVEASRG